MSRSALIRNWDKDLAGLDEKQLGERLALARDFEARSMKKGMGRNPKAAREWRRMCDAVEAEIERRSTQAGWAIDFGSAATCPAGCRDG
jgi:hypothetical protein